jgi:hypothetical protein
MYLFPALDSFPSVLNDQSKVYIAGHENRSQEENEQNRNHPKLQTIAQTQRTRRFKTGSQFGTIARFAIL